MTRVIFFFDIEVTAFAERDRQREPPHLTPVRRQHGTLRDPAHPDRPYRPQTNGKAERFIQTALREWAYRRPYRTSAHRTTALAYFQRRYNERRDHSAIGDQPPLSRLQELL